MCFDWGCFSWFGVRCCVKGSSWKVLILINTLINASSVDSVDDAFHFFDNLVFIWIGLANLVVWGLVLGSISLIFVVCCEGEQRFLLEIGELLWIIELMGGRSSREASWRQDSSFRSTSSSWDPQTGYLQSPYGQESQNYPPQTYPPPQTYSTQQYYPSSEEHSGNTRKLDRRYSRIADDYKSLDQVWLHILRSNFM